MLVNILKEITLIILVSEQKLNFARDRSRSDDGWFMFIFHSVLRYEQEEEKEVGVARGR